VPSSAERTDERRLNRAESGADGIGDVRPDRTRTGVWKRFYGCPDYFGYSLCGVDDVSFR